MEQSLQALLSQDERDRADRFVFDRDRHAYMAARSALRTLLGQYLGCPPHQVAFAYGPHGKPFLSGQSRLRFNLSHSGSMALCAFTYEHEIGADIEYVDENVNDEAIAKRFFSRDEVAALMSYEPDQRPNVFFSIWTRKEAFIKALGEGLTHPLDTFTVSAAPEVGNVPLLSVPVRESPCSSVPNPNWSLYSLPVPAQDYVAAVAVQTPSVTIERYVWSWSTDADAPEHEIRRPHQA